MIVFGGETKDDQTPLQLLNPQLEVL